MTRYYNCSSNDMDLDFKCFLLANPPPPPPQKATGTWISNLRCGICCDCKSGRRDCQGRLSRRQILEVQPSGTQCNFDFTSSLTKNISKYIFIFTFSCPRSPDRRTRVQHTGDLHVIVHEETLEDFYLESGLTRQCPCLTSKIKWVGEPN